MSLSVHPTEIVQKSSSPLLAIHPSWERIPLGEIASIQNGAAFKSSYFNKRREGMPLLRIRDVGADGTQAHYHGPYEERYLVEPGDLIVGMDGDFRVARWQGAQSLLNQRVCRIDVQDPSVYDSRFLLYVLPGYLDAVHEFTSSVTVKHLSSKTVAQIPIPLPPLPEQRRIVEAIETHLSRIDAGVENLHRAQRNIERMRASILKAAVEGRLVPQDPNDEPAEKLLERHGYSGNGDGELPPQWAWLQLGDVATHLRNGIFVSRPNQDVSGTAIFRISAVRPMALEVEDVRYAHDLDPEKEPRYFVDSGDLLFTRYSGNPDYVGACALIRSLPRPTLHPDKLIRVTVDNRVLVPAFAEVAVSAGASLDFIRRHRKTTAGQTGIAGGELKKTPIPVPPIDEQRRIADEVDRQLSLLASLATAANVAAMSASALKRSILREAFLGRLVSQEPTDEPASILLDRIRAEREGATV